MIAAPCRRHPGVPTIRGEMKRLLRVALWIPLLWLTPGAPSFSAGRSHGSLRGLNPAPRVGQTAPSFRLSDTTGRRRSLAEFRGRPVALFVFCGCGWCAAVAHEWAAAQRSDALLAASATAGASNGAALASPITVVVGSGLETKGCRALGDRAGFDAAQTVLLTDPGHHVMEMYHAELCPRVFIISADGVLRYVNRGKEDTPRKVPAATIVEHALAALRASGR
jgi:Redoxin